MQICWCLCSADSMTLIVPATHCLMLDDRAFLVSAAQTWNAMPSAVRDTLSLASFWQKFKRTSDIISWWLIQARVFVQCPCNSYNSDSITFNLRLINNTTTTNNNNNLLKSFVIPLWNICIVLRSWWLMSFFIPDVSVWRLLYCLLLLAHFWKVWKCYFLLKLCFNSTFSIFCNCSYHACSIWCVVAE